MNIADVCTRRLAMALATDTVAELAERMRAAHVGDLVIVENQNGKSVAVGIVTDRDIVLEIIALHRDPKAWTAANIMAPQLHTAEAHNSVTSTIMQMHKLSVRRLPVVDQDGELIGLVSLDDLLQIVAAELGALAAIASQQRERETQSL